MRLLILALGFCLISGCADNVTGSAVDLYGYFDRAASIEELVTNMKNDGFRYDNDLNDISYATDTHVMPEVVFNRKYGNCHDYAYFYAEFCKRKGLEYKIYILRKGWNWHYIIFTNGLCLSNISYSFDTLDDWYDRGYEYQKEIK